MSTADASTYADVIRHAITRARRARDVKPSQLAKRMATLGYPWHPQTVSNVESGRRRITAEELLGLSIALETPVGELLSPVSPGLQVEYVQVPAGQRLLASMVRSMATSPIYAGWAYWGPGDELRWPSSEFMDEYARLEGQVTVRRRDVERALSARTNAQTAEAQATAVAEMREAEGRLSSVEGQLRELLIRGDQAGGPSK